MNSPPTSGSEALTRRKILGSVARLVARNPGDMPKHLAPSTSRIRLQRSHATGDEQQSRVAGFDEQPSQLRRHDVLYHGENLECFTPGRSLRHGAVHVVGVEAPARIVC